MTSLNLSVGDLCYLLNDEVLDRSLGRIKYVYAESRMGIGDVGWIYSRTSSLTTFSKTGRNRSELRGWTRRLDPG